MTIPAQAHFVWLGSELLWVHAWAVASAALQGGFAQVVLHHDAELGGSAPFRALSRVPGVATEKLDVPAELERAGGAPLVDVYRELATPAARSNVLRIALLHGRGGVYLDTDTITVQSLAPLLSPGGAFCGTERIVFPAERATGVLSRLRPAAIARMAARDVLRRLPRGYRFFRHVEAHYPVAANNAVLGAQASHPLLAELLARMRTMAPARRRVRYALGTHLLQAAVADYRGGDLRVLPPAAFYPLGPEISEHWFRSQSTAVALADVVGPETFVVHWYASVRTRPHVAPLDATFVRAHAEKQLFAALALPTVDALERL